MSYDGVELEAWFVSKNDKARWPSGRYGRTMSAGEPFKVTNPNAIAFFNKVAANNQWLRKMRAEEAAVIVGVDQNSPAERRDVFVKTRQMADQKIAELDKKITYLEDSNASKDDINRKLEGQIEGLGEERDNYKEQLEEAQLQLKENEKQLNKLGKKISKLQSKLKGE